MNVKMNAKLFLAIAVFVVSAVFPRFAGATGCPAEAQFQRSDGKWTCKLRSENSDSTCTYYNSTRASECTKDPTPEGGGGGPMEIEL